MQCFPTTNLCNVLNHKNILKQEYVCLRYIGFEKRRNFLIGVNHVDFIELKPTAQLVVLLTLKIKMQYGKVHFSGNVIAGLRKTEFSKRFIDL